MDLLTFGSDDEGFSIGRGTAAGTLSVRVWGFWTDDTAGKLVGSVIAACGSAECTALTIDAGDLKPLRDAGQEALGALFAALPAYKVRRIVVTAAGALTRLQLLRIIKERATPNLVQFGA